MDGCGEKILVAISTCQTVTWNVDYVRFDITFVMFSVRKQNFLSTFALRVSSARRKVGKKKVGQMFAVLN